MTRINYIFIPKELWERLDEGTRTRIREFCNSHVVHLRHEPDYEFIRELARNYVADNVRAKYGKIVDVEVNYSVIITPKNSIVRTVLSKLDYPHGTLCIHDYDLVLGINRAERAIDDFIAEIWRIEQELAEIVAERLKQKQEQK